MWHAGAPGGRKDYLQTHYSDAEEPAGYRDRDARRRAQDTPLTQTRQRVHGGRVEYPRQQLATVGEPFHGRNKGDWDQRTTTATTTVYSYTEKPAFTGAPG